MASLKGIGREQVLAAIAEYDQLGQDEFLSKYGFKPARGYVLVHSGEGYDSKAIVGVAHGYLPQEQPLKASEFSGGEATVGRLLRDLGFVVSVGRIVAVAALVDTFFTGVPFVELLGEVGLSETGIAAGIGAIEEPVLPASPAEEAYRTYYKLYELAKRGLHDRDGKRIEQTVLNAVRSTAARKAVLVRSGGQCENPSCGVRLPDVTDVGDPILEIDHVWDLALGGLDDPAQMVALCPNCHAIKTRGRTRETLRQVLPDVARTQHDRMLRQ